MDDVRVIRSIVNSYRVSTTDESIAIFARSPPEFNVCTFPERSPFPNCTSSKPTFLNSVWIAAATFASSNVLTLSATVYAFTESAVNGAIAMLAATLSSVLSALKVNAVTSQITLPSGSAAERTNSCVVSSALSATKSLSLANSDKTLADANTYVYNFDVVAKSIVDTDATELNAPALVTSTYCDNAADPSAASWTAATSPPAESKAKIWALLTDSSNAMAMA